MAHLVGAVGGLAAPDREDGGAVDAEPSLDLVEDAAILPREVAARLGQAGDAGIIDIGLRRAGEFRLAARRALFPSGRYQIGEAGVRHDAAERAVERVSRNAEGAGVWPERGAPRLERGAGVSWRDAKARP
jgi:hypothetical protein